MAATSFSETSLSKELLSTVAELGFEKLTPIQAQSIPLILQGKDLVGQSKTGSGKTAAFALPLLQNIELGRRQAQALILCPTRELCAQVAREVKRFGRNIKDLQVLILAGGQPIRPQAEALAMGVHIVVGTPGRVLDLIGREALELSTIKYLVLDEADRMLDMGFEDEMESILKALPHKRQTLFFSATFPPSIKRMSKRYQKNPEVITVESEQEALAIEHVYYEMDEYEKTPTLIMALKSVQPESALVFCNRKDTVAELFEALKEKAVSVSCLHGDLNQEERNEELAKFRNNSTRILIATDVAARGLDIDHIQLVVNYDLPFQGEDYIHRVGRTGRAGRSGTAISLITEANKEKLEELEKATSIKLQKKKRDFTHSGAGQSAGLEAQRQTLYIAGGRKDKLRPGDILGALTGEAGGLTAGEIGKIEIHDKFAYVAITVAKAKQACDRLSEGRIKGRRFFVKLLR